ncbi:hypothetical protein SDC9_184690 [bioreactor metagenome]|uniref:Uncharacterized protein n=1 Tax=bioreactor metagenome TaxID=1076179 RepID=A0A645HM40_9ZZZZ
MVMVIERVSVEKSKYFPFYSIKQFVGSKYHIFSLRFVSINRICILMVYDTKYNDIV